MTSQLSPAPLTGRGTMAALVQAHDWSSTPLGPIAGWPQSLRVAVGICLNSRFPMFVWWGPELINIYNDAYIPVLGKRHPHALGRPARAIWHEIWDVIGPQADAVMQRGEATWNERVLLVMERHGYTEETYFTWSYSPIPDESGRIGGLFCACTEDTPRVLAERERDRLAGQKQLALNAAAMGWWHLDPATQIATYDERFREIFGLTGTSQPNAQILARLHPDDRPAVSAKVQAALTAADPLPYVIEYRIRRGDGAERWIEAHGQAVFEGDGAGCRATSLVGTVADVTDRRRALEQPRTILESITDAFFTVDRDWRFTYLNRQAERTLRSAPGELLGKVMWDAYPGLTGSEFERVYRRTAAEGVSLSVTSFYPDHDRWYEVRTYPTSEGISVYFRDVSERKRDEEALRESQQRLSAILDNIRAMVYVVDADNRFLFINRRWEAVFGLTSASAAGRSIYEFFSREVADAFAANNQRVLQSGRPHEAEEVAPHAEETRTYISVKVPLFDAAGRAYAVCGMSTDITERKHIEAERERLAVIVNASRDAVIGVGLDGIIQTWNPGAERMLGYPAAEAIGQPVTLITPPDRRDEPRQLLDLAARGQRPPEVQTVRRRKDGSTVDVSVSVDPIVDSSGKITAVVGVLRDISDSVRAERELRASEQRYRDLFTSIDEGFCVVEMLFDEEGKPVDYRFIELNPAFERHSGLRRAAGRRMRELAPGHEQHWFDVYGRVATTGEPVRFVNEAKALGQRWFDVNAFRVGGADSRRVGILFTDITDRRRTAERLSQTTERFDLAQRAAHIGVYDWDIVTGDVVWSEEEERLFGLQPGTFEGNIDGWSKRVLPDDLPRMLEALSEAMARRERETDFAFRIARPDGAVRWIEGSGRFIYDAAGKPLRMVGVNVDVTERKRAAARVARLYAVAAALSEARSTADVARVTVEQGIGALGATAGSLSLLSEDGAGLEMAGSVGYPPEVISRWQRIPLDAPIPLTDAVRSGEAIYLATPEERLRRYPALAQVRATSETHASACVPLLIGGKPVGVLGLSFDRAGVISAEDRAFILSLSQQCGQALERARLFEAEQRARAAAERASEAKSEFLATLSHELRTPLTPVLLTVSLMESDPALPESFRDDVATIRRNVELESQLISDLLDLTRIARGKLQLDLQDLDLHLIVRSAIDICQRDASAKLTVDLRAARHTVRGDSTRLQQIFWNLVSNAMKFTGADGAVTVRSSDTGDGRIRVEVIDTGVGIDPAVLPRLFNAFEQGEARSSRQQAGLGLGLTISRKLAEIHGGTITAASAGRGRGATFTVELPVIPSAVPDVVPPRPRRAEGAGASLSVLLVEDHEATLNVMTKLLRALGHHVTGSSSVASATATARQGRFDVIICDVGLPDGSGLDVMRQLRDRYAGRAIALTGYGMESDVAATRDAGFTEHLTKPVDLTALQAAIDRVARKG